MMRDRGQKVLSGILIGWGLYALLFVFFKPMQTGSHDFEGHLRYVDILMHQKRFPMPLEGWETHQMPLYYLINSLIRLPLGLHVQMVRLLSIIYGLSFLLVLSSAVRRVSDHPALLFFTLLFTATTPKFIFLFTSYNNDALAISLAAAFLLLAWDYGQDPDDKRAGLLFLVGLAGIYTKLTFVFALGSVSLAGWLSARRGGFSKSSLVHLHVLLAAILLALLPWLYLHNYRATGQWIVPSGIRPEAALRHSPLRTIVNPPGLLRGEWRDPFIHMEEVLKSNSFLSYAAATSVFGEATFPAIPVLLSWAILAAHVVLLIFSFSGVFRSRFTEYGGTLVGLSMAALAAFLVVCPTHPSMDFRFIAWAWLPMGILLAGSLERLDTWSFRVRQRARIFLSAVLLAQVVFLLIWLFLPGRGYI